MIIASVMPCFIHSLLHMFCVSKDYGGVMIPSLCTWYSNSQVIISAQYWGAPLFSLETLFYSNHKIFCSIGFSDLFDCVPPLGRSVKGVSFYLQSFDPQYS